MRGLIRDCFANSHVCTRVLARFPRIASPIHGKSFDIHVGCSAHVEVALRTSFNHENSQKLYQNARGEHE